MKNRHLFLTSFLLGAAAIVWVGAGFVQGHALALMMTFAIALVYGVGAWELRQFRQTSDALEACLVNISHDLASVDEWLARVPSGLRNPVRLRLDGERVALPGPALTPYLVGLLVMLGMLGTFLGMVVTLNGAAFSLEGTADLQAIRSALAAPIKGLGLAFGTSVAGVAASSMLGLMSALSRRERAQVGQLLDSQIGTQLRRFSHRHQRELAYSALQSQAQHLPALVQQLQAMMAQMQQSSEQLNQRLLGNQTTFHGEVKVLYQDLAHSVDQSLKDSLTHSAQAALQTIEPLVQSAMTGMAAQSRELHQRAVDSTQTQLRGLAEQLSTTTATVTQTWTASLARFDETSATVVDKLGHTLGGFTDTFDQSAQGLLNTVADGHARLTAQQTQADLQRQQAWDASLAAAAATLKDHMQQASQQAAAQQQQICATLAATAQDITQNTQTSAATTLAQVSQLLESSEKLIQGRLTSEAQWSNAHTARMEQIATLLRTELGALRDDEAHRGNAAVDRLGELQSAMTQHVTTLGTALEEPITRLIEVASEAPRAAAEVIGQLRQEMTHGLARDNALLEERSRIMNTLNALLDSIRIAATEQRGVIDAMVASSAVALNHTGSQFAQQVDAEAAKLSQIADQVTSGAVEVASLGDTLGFAVTTFSQANDKLIEHLQRIEAALDKSMARSDEQLAYYVAQAREVIDLSVMSQKEVFEELRRLPSQQAASTAEVN